MNTRTFVCSTPGCPHLRPCPVPGHTRDSSQPWSKDRDRQAQHQFRQAVLARDGNRCVKCGSTGPLVAHHVRPGYDAEAGMTLCESCHRGVDSNAR